MAGTAEDTENPDARVLREDRDGIVRLTLNRPDRYNTLSLATLCELNELLDSIAADHSARVVVLGARGKAFCAGHDLKARRANRDRAFLEELFAVCSRMMQELVDMPQPVIAMVQGIATAAGCQLVASCDLVVAASSARFATSGVNYGVFCSTPAVALGRAVARKNAFEMLVTGEFIGANRAAEIGLVNRVVGDVELETATLALARQIASKSSTAVRTGKASFYRQIDEPLDAAYRLASEDIVCNLLSDDGAEGLDAFFEKREPKWRE
jgi:enoyl-CoA hydratase/carnithine racemase